MSPDNFIVFKLSLPRLIISKEKTLATQEEVSAIILRQILTNGQIEDEVDQEPVSWNGNRRTKGSTGYAWWYLLRETSGDSLKGFYVGFCWLYVCAKKTWRYGSGTKIDHLCRGKNTGSYDTTWRDSRRSRVAPETDFSTVLHIRPRTMLAYEDATRWSSAISLTSVVVAMKHISPSRPCLL